MTPEYREAFYSEPLRCALRTLDRYLTGKDSRANSQDRDKLDIEQFVYQDNGVFYLSDGGYSRILLRMNSERERYELDVTFNFSTPLIERWEHALPIREVVEDIMNRWADNE